MEQQPHAFPEAASRESMRLVKTSKSLAQLSHSSQGLMRRRHTKSEIACLTHIEISGQVLCSMRASDNNEKDPKATQMFHTCSSMRRHGVMAGKYGNDLTQKVLLSQNYKHTMNN